MIGLAVLMMRVCLGTAKLAGWLLVITVRWGFAALRRRASATRHEAGPAPAARRDSELPSRRRAFTAPRRTRRTVA